MKTGSPKVFQYERANKSEPALEAEYGEFGATNEFSVQDPSLIEP
jgi:hypothetical protein